MATADFFRTAPTEQLRLLRLPQLLELVPLSKRRIDQLEAVGEFPRRVALGANAIAWNEYEVREWLAQRAEQGRTNALGARASYPLPSDPELAKRGHATKRGRAA